MQEKCKCGAKMFPIGFCSNCGMYPKNCKCPVVQEKIDLDKEFPPQEESIVPEVIRRFREAKLNRCFTEDGKNIWTLNEQCEQFILEALAEQKKEIMEKLVEAQKITRRYTAKDIITAEIMKCYFRNGINEAINIVKEI